MILRRILRRLGRDAGDAADLTPVPDDVPRDDLFTEPLVVSITSRDPESLEDRRHRVEFRVEIRDTEGRRCPDLAVEAEIAGPGRTATGLAHTDMLGRVRFQMDGPAGRYRLRLLHVAGHALDLDEEASDLTAARTVDPPA